MYSTGLVYRHLISRQNKRPMKKSHTVTLCSLVAKKINFMSLLQLLCILPPICTKCNKN